MTVLCNAGACCGDQEYERTVQEDPEAEQAGAGFYLMRSELFGRHLVLLAVPKATAPHLAIITRPNTGKQQTEVRDAGPWMA